MPTKQTARRIAWLRVSVFALAAFIFNTTEFVPVALLSDIGAGFGMTVPQVGLMITVYAWMVALLSLPCMLVTAKIERRRLLLGVLAVFVFGHVLSVAAPNYPVLLAGRITIALAHAVFWSVTTSLVLRLAPLGKKAKALGLLTLGSSMAMILGLPLGRMLGQWLGWRMTFAVIGIAALALMVLMARVLPRLDSKNAGSLSSLPQLARRPLLIGIFAFTAAVFTAHFTVYSYIEPFVVGVAGFSAAATTTVLTVFGLSAVAASWLFGRFYEGRQTLFLFASAAVLMAALALMRVSAASPPAFFALAFVWEMAATVLYLCLIVRILALAADATDVANSIYSGIINIGIGSGALLGGVIIRSRPDGLAELGWFAAAICAAAIVWLFWVSRRFAGTARNKAA